MPDELAVIAFFEPTPECVVPAQVGIHGVVHRRDITLPSNLTASDDLP
jgi:hypothetical protein